VLQTLNRMPRCCPHLSCRLSSSWCATSVANRYSVVAEVPLQLRTVSTSVHARYNLTPVFCAFCDSSPGRVSSGPREIWRLTRGREVEILRSCLSPVHRDGDRRALACACLLALSWHGRS